MLVWDIETGPLPDVEIGHLYDPSECKTGNLKDPAKIEAKQREHREAFYERAALDATLGETLAIGVCDGQEKWRIGRGACDDNEHALLTQFWADFAASDEPWVGHYIFGFDLPFLVRRSWLLDVDMPPGVRIQRYWSEQFVDTLEIWKAGNRQDSAKLGTLAKAFGHPGKLLNAQGEEITGVEFAELWRAEETRDEALKYLDNDLEMTWTVASRLM